MYDTSCLYPVVHDLDEAEYNPVSWCVQGMCLSLPLFPPPLGGGRSPAASPTRRRTSIDESLDDSDATNHSVESVYTPPRPERFQDAYVLTRQIYQGRYSMVWESIDRQSGLRYATKMFDRRTLTPQEDAAVLREADILQQIGSGGEGTISCIDFYQEPTHYYLVSEFAEGGSLQMKLVEQKRLDEEDVKQLARSLLEGLVHLHSQDVCHRNLKPDNILLQDESSVLIADFGLAIPLPYFDGARGKLSGKCGSSFYAAPEIQNRKPYDTQADMWSLGVILFLALSGSLPFLDRNRRGLLRKISKAEYIFDPKDWSTVSREARRFISKLLRANPQERMTARQALQHSWLAHPPQPCVAVDAPIERTLTETTLPSKKVRFDDVPKPPSKRKTPLKQIFSILRMKKDPLREVDNESISSQTTSSCSTDPPSPNTTRTVRQISI